MKFEGFLDTGTRTDKLRELAAFLANAAHESGGFQYIEEINKSPYREQHSKYPANPNKQYYGRGPLQLTWNYNYGAFSEDYFNNKRTLLDDPNRVAEHGDVGFASAIWFWMTQPTSSTSAHASIHRDSCRFSNWGFGRTTLTVTGAYGKGAVEGGSSNKDKQLTKRIRFYRQFADELGIKVGVNGEQLDTRNT